MDPSSLPADLVIVGGGPTALTAAHSYRDHGGGGRVVMLSSDTALPYERPPLSKHFLRGELADQELTLTAGDDLEKLDIEVLLHRRVTRLDAQGRLLRTADGETFGYRTCLLATGARPLPLPVPGGDSPSVLQLRSLESARRLRQRAADARRAIVIGSGFIGCEAAASLSRLGLSVTLVTAERGPQQDRLGGEAAERISGWLRDEGVALALGVHVEAIDVGSNATTVMLGERQAVTADLVLAAVGVRPDSVVADEAGIPLRDGRVLVDERMRTRVDGVLAAGDVASARNALAGRHLSVEHWGEALAMGEVAGATAAGADATWAEVPGFWSEIGDRVLKYVAWGDGYDDLRVDEHADGAFTIWYGRDGVTVGVLTHEADGNYERGRAMIEHKVPLDRTTQRA